MVSLPFLCGIKPKKRKSEVITPEIEKAAVRALAPGIASIFIFFCEVIIRFIKTAPGSEIPGVPASVTMAILVPDSSEAMIASIFSSVLWVWKLSVLVVIS